MRRRRARRRVQWARFGLTREGASLIARGWSGYSTSGRSAGRVVLRRDRCGTALATTFTRLADDARRLEFLRNPTRRRQLPARGFAEARRSCRVHDYNTRGTGGRHAALRRRARDYFSASGAKFLRRVGSQSAKPTLGGGGPKRTNTVWSENTFGQGWAGGRHIPPHEGFTSRRGIAAARATPNSPRVERAE